MGKYNIRVIEGDNVDYTRKNAYEYLFKLIIEKLKESKVRDE